MLNNSKNSNSGKTTMKLLATLLVITLTFANFALLGSYIRTGLVSYASEINLTNQDNKTNSDNVSFDVYLDESNKGINTISKDLNEENLNLYLSVSVQNGGYLRNGKIELLDTNFSLKDESYIKSLDLEIIQAGKGTNVILPIIAKKDNTFNLGLLNMVSQIKLTGEYIDNEGNVIDINTIKGVQVSWTSDNLSEENNPIYLNQEVITNKIYSENGTNKRILQIKVNSGITGSAYPIKTTAIKAYAPQLDETYPEKVVVASYGTIATNNKTSIDFVKDDGNIEEENKVGVWSYDETNKVVNIQVNNKANSNNNVSWEKSGEDTFIITYVYPEITETTNVSSKIENEIELYISNAKLSSFVEFSDMNIEEIDGEIYILNYASTNEIYKGKMYLGQDTEIYTRWDLQLSYADLIDSIIIEDKQYYFNDDETNVAKTKYVSTYINKEKMLDVLGEEGKILIYNKGEIVEGTLPTPIVVLDKDTAVNENGYIVVNYVEDISDIYVSTTKPIKEGKLDITNKKVLKADELTEEQIAAINKLNMKFNANINGILIEKEIENLALEPFMDFDVDLTQEKISVKEEDTLRITAVLKSDSEKYKLFKDPKVSIELPSEVKEVSIENISLLYDDELTIQNSEIIENGNGNKVIVIDLLGEQTKYNKVELQGGANIVLDLKMNSDKLASNKNANILVTVNNNEENLQKTKNLQIVNIKGILNETSITTSVTANTVINERAISANILKGTSAVLTHKVINNYSEDIKNAVIQGELPVDEEGILTSILTNSIVTDVASEIYYSEDLQNWDTNVTDFSKVRAFKIVMQNAIQQGQIINLQAALTGKGNTTISLTGTVNEQLINDKTIVTLNMEEDRFMALKQSNNILLSITPKTTISSLYEGQIVTYDVKVTNTSSNSLDNVTLEHILPEGSVYTELTYAQGKITTFTDDEETTSKNWKIGTIAPNQTIFKEVTIKIKEGATQIVNNLKLKNNQNQILAELATDATPVSKGDLSVILSRRDNMVANLTSGNTIQYVVIVKNNTNTTMNNLIITSKIPSQTLLKQESEYNSNWTYDSNSNELSYTIDTLAAGETKDIRFEVKIEELDNNYGKGIIDNTIVVSTEDNKKYESNIFRSTVLMPDFEISMTSEHPQTLNEGDSVKYIIKIKNTGERSGSFTVKDTLPEEIQFRKLTYYISEGNKKEDTVTKREIIVYEALNKGQILTIEIEGVTFNLDNNVKSKEITNFAEIYLGNEKHIESEKIVNTIVNDTVVEPTPQEPATNPTDPEDPTDPTEDPTDPTPVTEEYSISGIAWLDENGNGIREDEEKSLNKIKVYLLDKDGNVVKDEDGKEIYETTSLLGKYKFKNLATGNYIVVFEYDTNEYAVTKYQVDESNDTKNSDFISKSVKINEETKLVALSNELTIKNKDLENVDLGLILANKFDLSLNKYVTKMVVTNRAGTSRYNYDGEELAKIEIKAKYFTGSSIVTEYKIEITNEGTIEGYVSDIIDYIPKEMAFNSELNPDWYLGTDGYLHNITLTQDPIAVGETKVVKLVLTKTLKENQAGVITNIAEIGQSSNIKAIAESDSEVGNKNLKEDDIGTAEILISISTGSPIMYIGIVLVSILILGGGIYIIDKKVLKDTI